MNYHVTLDEINDVKSMHIKGEDNSILNILIVVYIYLTLLIL